MDKIELILCSCHHGDIRVSLSQMSENNYCGIPSGEELVYNDDDYYFLIEGISIFPSKVYINDEIFDVAILYSENKKLSFKIKDNDKPFLHSFGAVKIEMDIDAQTYVSDSIVVMVSNTDINNGIINMVQYIYDNYEQYLYGEHKYSYVSTGIKKSNIISIEAKIACLNEILNVYKEAYHYLKINPYSKLEKTESVDVFDKLQTISSSTIRYIVTHTDELVAVGYNTGIRYDRKYYQPNKTLIEHNSYSFDIYENQVVVGFLSTLVDEINRMIKNIQEYSCMQNKEIVRKGYIDSMYQIFSKSIKKITGYIQKLTVLNDEFHKMYFYYVKIFDIMGIKISNMPMFTPVFRSINVYRHIYNAIYNWFSCGNYDLRKEDLLLSFISTSKIYEYYCLVKLLYYLDKYSDFNFIEAKRLTYINNNYYSDTRYNNCFVFARDGVRITFYFQPVIYGDSFAVNGIDLYRSTSSNSRIGNKNKGKTYNPDYLLKIDFNDHAEYLIMDAKFSNPNNIKNYQLQELVYKYLFSISTLEKQDLIKGLYIICGKTSNNDEESIVHDIARLMHKKVNPFAEILVMNGTNTDDYSIPEILFRELL